MIKRFFLYIICISAFTSAFGFELADSTASIIDRLNSHPSVSINIPDALPGRLIQTPEQATEEETHQSTANHRVGYRVLAFDDNTPSTAQHAAQARKQQIASRFPEFAVYVQFNSPYWRVKVGDFRTRSDAENALAAIRQAFPQFSSQLRIVRDRINTSK